MDVSPAATARSPAIATERSGPQISSDFEMFLKMLTVQLKNQDPLNPVESADYAVQLATFSGVEQQVLTNDLLKQMMGQGGASHWTQMGAWVGQEVRVAAPAQFAGTPVTLWTAPATGADRAQLVVTDAQGHEVQRLTLPLPQGPIDWAGVASDGGALPAGLYRFTVESFAGETALPTTPAEIYASVQEVRRLPEGIKLVLAGGVEVDSSAVTALRPV